MSLKKQTQTFRDKIAALPREDILSIIHMQNPDLIPQIERCEWVFRNKMSHLTWDDGTPIESRDFTNEDLALIVDEPFEYSEDLGDMGLTLQHQQKLHLAKDPVTWAKNFLQLDGGPVEPHVYQILMLRHPNRFKVLRAGRRLGKALAIDTPIPTPNGWTTMKELEVGDQVFDEQGKPCNVTFVTDVQWDRKCFKVHFSDGSSLIADEDHQWTVDTKQSRKARGRAQNPQSGPITLTTKDMLDKLYVWAGDKYEVNYSIDNTQPVEYTAKPLPVHPWLFGLWLADGTGSNANITIGEEDQKEVLSRIQSLGYSYVKTSDPIGFRIEGLYKQLNSLGVLRKYRKANKNKCGGIYPDNEVRKFIPEIYLQGSVEQRELLLQGLMDGDGHVTKSTNCEISLCNKDLSENVYELIQSLGYRATFKSSDSTLYGRVVGTRYRINFTPWRPVFKLTRKLARQKLNEVPSARQRCRYIVAIEKVDSVPVKCISVDSPNSLYLAGKNFIPTHNTFSMALLLLWYSYTTKNGRSIVLTPMQAQANLIYEEILKLVGESPMVQESVTRTVASPPAEINFKNGSTIRFFTSGMKSGGRSDATRGQEAHLIVLDELDYMGDEDLEAVLAMMQKTSKNQPEKLLIGASTPSGKRAIFYKWCHDPKRFKEFWFPSYANPFWDKDDEDFLRSEHKTEMGYRHEVEADWGELAEGVYPRRLVDVAFNTIDDYDYVPGLTSAESTYVIGVDWDKYGAGTNIVVLELFDNRHSNTVMRGKTKLCHREETTREGYSLLTAVDRIIELNKNFNPDWIYIDRGYGDVQLELLHRHGVDNPHTKLNTRVKGIQFAQTIEVRDPFTMEKVRKEIKPFMVSTLKEMLEQGRIVFPKSDTNLYDQLNHYVVTRTTSTGRPVYEMAGSDIGDHAHDALMLATLAVTQNYNKLFQINYATKTHTVSNSTFMSNMPVSGNPSQAKVQIEQAQKQYGSINAAPIQIKRSMTGSLKRGDRPIKRKMF